MGLTTEDLSQIRSIFREENKTLQDEIQALHNDVKEIYDELGKINGHLNGIERSLTSDGEFAKLSTKDKLLRLNSELLLAAKEAGITLPR